MGGTDNLLGVDFQITYCVLQVLLLLQRKSSFCHIQFEGLDDEGQDLTINYTHELSQLIQVKKRGEGYQWSPSTVRPIIQKFIRSFDRNNEYIFFSDGSMNIEMIDLREALESNSESLIKQKTPESLKPAGVTENQILGFLMRCKFMTRQYVSADPDDPALNLKIECQRILSAAPFTPLLDIDRSIQNLWTLVFQKSKQNGRITFDELQHYARSAGLLFAFNGYPIISQDVCFRERETDILKNSIESSDAFFVYGISGTGKSTAVAQCLLERNELGKVLWFSTAPSYNSTYFRKVLATFLESAGNHNQALPLRDMRLDDLDSIDQVLTNTDVTVVFDAVEKASPPLEHLWSSLLRKSKSSNRISNIIFIGQQLESWFVESAAYVKRSKYYHLTGFSHDDFIAYINPSKFDMENSEFGEFFAQTGGLPIAASLLKATLVNANMVETSHIIANSSDVIQNMLFTKIISHLDENEREFIEAASVFESEFSIEDVNLLLDRPMKSKTKILSLIPKCILNELSDGMRLHDSIRPLAYALLLRETAISYHEVVATHYADLMKTQGHRFELIDRWGYHVERCDRAQSPYMKAVNELSPEEIFCLWGVYYSGFPFSFNKDDLTSNLAFATNFLKQNLIVNSSNWNSDKEAFDVTARTRVFELASADEFDTSFLWYKAERETDAWHMGYIDVNKPNYSWQMQRNVICPWEHRIEYEPLIPYDEDASGVRDWFANIVQNGGLSWRGSDANEKSLSALDDLVNQGGLEAGDHRLREVLGSCPIFGHCCPGGSTQASLCRSAEDMNGE